MICKRLEKKKVEQLEKVGRRINPMWTSEADRTRSSGTKLSLQWFLNWRTSPNQALTAVMDDVIQLYPPKFKNMYRLDGKCRDWCISRQPLVGHQIPAYYLPNVRICSGLNQEEL